MPRRRYVVDEDALTALLALEDSQITRLLSVIENLAEDSSIPADCYSIDDHGRRLPSKVAGEFLITYWSNPQTRTLYILRIDTLDA